MPSLAPSTTFTPDDLRQLLDRAVALEPSVEPGIDLAELRRIAQEAGIPAAALDAALAEWQAHRAHPRAPWWVRTVLWGVPDRRVAMGFYRLFAAALCTSPAWLWLDGSGAWTAVAVAWASGALWSTARAVRWLDRHGWERLP